MLGTPSRSCLSYNAEPSPALGVDLGTTNSAGAVRTNNETTILSNNLGARTTPSMVSYTRDGTFVVGEKARRQAVANPENTFYGVKHLMGRSFDDVRAFVRRLTYKTTKAPDGGVAISCPLLNKTLLPQQISSKVIRELGSDYTTFFNKEPKNVVITVPAYFDDAQRNATKDAGRIAQLDVLRIINEPTAAALAYGFDKSQNARIFVFDAGGGTFDVSLLEAGDGVFEVLKTGGDPSLGGDDIDDAITEWLINGFQETHGFDLRGEPRTLQRLKEAAEKAKLELSAASQAKINLPFIVTRQGKPLHLSTTLSRDTLDELLREVFERFRAPTLAVLREAGVSAQEIDHVILAGGTTRIPALQELVATELGQEPVSGINPDEVVAVGAAIQGEIITGDSSDVVLIDVTSLSLGLETLGGIHTKLIPRNTSLPTSKTQMFSTAADNQTVVGISVLQGEREFASDCKPLGTFELTGIQSAPRGVPQITVAFTIDVDGILTVRATEGTSGTSNELEIKDSTKRSDDDIRRMIEEANEFADQDQEKKMLVTLKIDAEAIIYEAQAKLQEGGDERNDADRIQGAIRDLQAALNRSEPASIKSCSDALRQLLAQERP
ncbi:chaperone DnaK (nucleomorph) [Lotharella oceanica]|uniref:Chaperone DnaK n=3 Tax=Lotharella oceanica TaxID=641309 RepID=A0A060DAD5_9EUKA|nr:chaperone DnaK [Lotharella oceanica]AIB09865.1 chaperone DnaK [Lotharella oceanica]